ncbi:MAG TPA: hypothetical protein PKD24_05975 [Pyrinomonadaceae bacterium]|nr:hypothetical protein [Pyrinomonadaceae bacterium]HMP65297.1 hypothetical protein [Pyrinomonadaceae bacterium]
MKILISLLSIVLFALSLSAHVNQSRGYEFQAKYPGVSPAQLKTLQSMNRTIPIPLPTWLPTGFTLEKIQSRLGRGVKVYDREFTLIFRRSLADGKFQQFALSAGFEGLGDLLYDETSIIKSPIGTIYLLYEPIDPEDGKRIEKYVMTQWFRVGSLDYHYVGMYGYEEGNEDHLMIPLADTERILRSLQRLK